MAAAFSDILSALSPEQPVLVAGPTASGKSALAMEIAERQGGVIVNADASQVYDCWRVITARPSVEEEEALPHVMYGHIAATAPYSTGHWLREVAEVLKGDQRPIITGGTGLYFRALTHGLTEMPSTPPDVRTEADGMSLPALIQTLDPRTKAEIDLNNRARVQRAWEVLTATGRGLADWQAETGTPLLPQESCYRVVFNVERDWLNARIARRFDLMLEQGALAEVEAVWPDYNPKLPAHRAIGVTELMGYVAGELTLDQAREATVIATRQYAKRQRTWARSKMADWHQFDPQTP